MSMKSPASSVFETFMDFLHDLFSCNYITWTGKALAIIGLGLAYYACIILSVIGISESIKHNTSIPSSGRLVAFSLLSHQATMACHTFAKETV